MEFQRAVKSKSKLRLALFGPSGSGKTYSALRIATGLGGNIALIDTERDSASLYADRFAFDVLDLKDKSIDGYIEAISLAEKEEYGVLIIDSLSHGWQELLEEIDRIAKTKYRGNSWSAWQEGTPKQRKLVDALLSFNGHIIATMRSKTEWTTEADDRGKNKPVRVGLAPEQGKGIEYEFTILIELSTEHIAHVIKDRTGRFQDRLIENPSEQLGQELLEWLSAGVEVPLHEEHIEETTVSDEIKAKILEVAAEKDKPVDDKRLKGANDSALKAVRDLLGTIPEEQRDSSVTMVINYIFGDKELSFGDCTALYFWAYASQNGEYVLKEASIKEAHGILLAAREQQVSTDELTEVEI
jgi:hypothetical protein